jgi:group I intron endonuclease
MKKTKNSSIGSLVQSNNSVIVKLPKYNNVDIEKLQILQDNYNKAGIYMFKNLINGKSYVGSSENLRARFLQYFNTNYLLRNTCMYICRALLKYDYSKFSLTIIEYCSPSKCLERERHYFYLLNPEYNLTQDPAAPMSGRKHSEKSKLMISTANIGLKKGENHPMYGHSHSEETKQKMSESAKKRKNSGRFKKGEDHPNFCKKHSPESLAKIPSQQISVFDKDTNEMTRYDSISAAARALNINNGTISKYFANNQTKPYKGKYIFKKIQKKGLPVGKRFYTTGLNRNLDDLSVLNPNWISGFIDGEGCFHISVYSRSSSKLKWRVQANLEFGLHKNELPLLLGIQQYFKGVGNIFIDSKNNVAYFKVSKIEDLINIVIPHFNSYPLLTNKRKDFIL